LTTKQAAGYLCVHPLTLRRWHAEGRVQAHKISGNLKPTYRWRVADLDALMEVTRTQNVIADEAHPLHPEHRQRGLRSAVVAA
jgi:excisionase family DNA binding protein